MQWTSEWPKFRGVYWFRNPSTAPTIVLYDGLGKVLFLGGNSFIHLGNLTVSEFAGPIEEPEG